MKKRLLMVVLTLSLIAIIVSGCSPPTAGPTAGGDTGAAKTPVKIGSKIDTEGQVLGQLIIQALQAKGIMVEDKTRTGTTDVVRKALTVGEIDGYPEYTASALTQFFPAEKIPPSVLKSAAQSYALVTTLDLAKNKIVWLMPAPANNTWAVAIPAKLAADKSIGTLEDWAKYISGGGAVKMAGSQEFFTRSDAFPAFEKAYGFTLKPDQKVVLATGDTAVTQKAASQGTNGVNAAMAYGTDGSIAALSLITLEDPKQVQPVYAPAPTFRAEVIKMYPEIVTTLAPIFAKLDTAALQKLNGDVAVAGKPAAEVAKTWLQANGFLQ
jgi:osmoprotectant transport system substrate-binding protein